MVGFVSDEHAEPVRDIIATMRESLRLGVLALTLLVGTSAAEDDASTPLSPGDSLTVDGTRYTCGSKASSGVQMAIGDMVTVGNRRLRCGAAAAGNTSVQVRSFVDTECLEWLERRTTRKLELNEATARAAACRPLSPAPSCKAATTSNDQRCIQALGKSAKRTPDSATAIAESCVAVEVTCAGTGRSIAAAVSLSCLQRKRAAWTTKAEFENVLSWVDTCREPLSVSADCVMVAASFDATIFDNALRMYPSSASPTQLAELATRSRKIEYRCASR